ncbi:MAG: Crp/Fnr family transcriptional regulator [Clostridia bacterium]|nr:Crp/Fnr family transcriptional regulator [Clostridia bacterium]MBQ2948541.1 Crp/Fnr family transcriptional regulator [Clostridia bacterium]MBQ7052876.1 Crp/Fnr family transcriptional regulator [Clostridia bacterium]
MDFAHCLPIWNKLTADQQEHILSVSEYRRVRAGTILHDGSPECMGLILVSSGQLRAYMLSEEGREVTICRFFERDICLFSASCVMPNMQFDIFISAEKDCELWIIPACLYKNLMNESLPVASYSCDLISHHFSELMWLMEQIMWKKFDERLAKFLLEESALENTPSLTITHDKIANHMGTAREVVTRMLRYFQNEGMVRLTRGSVEITDVKKLALLQGE